MVSLFKLFSRGLRSMFSLYAKTDANEVISGNSNAPTMDAAIAELFRASAGKKITKVTIKEIEGKSNFKIRDPRKVKDTAAASPAPVAATAPANASKTDSGKGATRPGARR